jgi:hypothetical protein
MLDAGRKGLNVNRVVSGVVFVFCSFNDASSSAQRDCKEIAYISEVHSGNEQESVYGWFTLFLNNFGLKTLQLCCVMSLILCLLCSLVI